MLADMVTDAPARQSRTQVQEDRRGEEVTEPINGECIVPFFWHLFRNPDIVQVHQFDILAAPAITASGTSEGHGAFSAAVAIVSGMIQLFLCKQGSIFRVIEVEPDGTIIMTQSGAESLM